MEYIITLETKAKRETILMSLKQIGYSHGTVYTCGEWKEYIWK